ncbi:MAG TPA: YihY/virulence factor BrkB family protein [Candidatus Binataceae bacterium]|nr:YihY/virulence factor BrkB family protein [Candidatus Binataceae bacterium]
MLGKLKDFLRQVLRDFSEDECPSMAAALAYATIFSLPSLLLIVIYIAGLVLGPKAATGEIQSRLSGAMGEQAAAEIQTMVSNVASNRAGGIIATLLGAVGLLLSATSVVMQLQRCLNRAWKVKFVGSGFRDTINRQLRSGLLLLGAGVLAIASVAASSVISAVSHMLPFAGAVSAGEVLASFVAFALLFGAILKAMPDVELQWRDVWAGGIFIALLFVVGKFLIGEYLAHGGKSSVYGAAGSLAMILLWTYYSALMFLLGVEFTQVWVRSQGREVAPKEGAVRLVRETIASAESRPG